VQQHLLKANIDILCFGYRPIRNKNSERFARNPVLLARPQIFVLHQNLQHVSSSEFIDYVKGLPNVKTAIAQPAVLGFLSVVR
jgi:hypothetical protein